MQDAVTSWPGSQTGSTCSYGLVECRCELASCPASCWSAAELTAHSECARESVGQAGRREERGGGAGRQGGGGGRSAGWEEEGGEVGRDFTNTEYLREG